MFITGETYSNRNYPRTCNPGNNYVIYLYDSAGKRVGSYGFIGWSGFGTLGSLKGNKLAKGTYKLMLVNQSYST